MKVGNIVDPDFHVILVRPILVISNTISGPLIHMGVDKNIGVHA